MAVSAEIVCDNIDRLVSVEVRMGGMGNGAIAPLYGAARESQGEPLSLAAARRLAAQVEKGDVVFLVTGVGLPRYLPHGETDGPPGVAALARALHMGLGAKPVFFVEEPFAAPLEASCRAVGMSVAPIDDALVVPHTAAIITVDVGVDGKAFASEMIDRYSPKAVVSAERVGPNVAGIRHSTTGKAGFHPFLARLEALFDEARSREILTIGIGDNGNEIGFGRIVDAVRQHREYGARCVCPCGRGTADVTMVDVLVVASISNWGAYAVEAALAFLLQKPELLHDGKLEARMIDACSKAGAADGSTGTYLPAVDAVPSEIHAAMVEVLGTLVRSGLRDRVREF